MKVSERTDTETAPKKTDVEALYRELFGTSALDALAKEEKESESFARVYKVAKKRPWVALRAAYEGVAAHFRGDGPFDYSVSESCSCGEVSQ